MLYYANLSDKTKHVWDTHSFSHLGQEFIEELDLVSTAWRWTEDKSGFPCNLTRILCLANLAYVRFHNKQSN